MASQTRTWGSRFEALTQESTPSSPDLHPCTTPSPVVSPPGLGPLSTSARDRTTTAPEHVKMGAHTNSMGDTDVHNHMRSTSYNIGGQYNNHAQHGPSSGHRVRHEASIFVAGLPGSIDDATMKRDLEDMLLAINNASESSSQPVDTVENSGKAAQLFKPIAVLDVHLVREARGGICAFIQVGSSDEASRVLDYAFLHPFAYHDTVLRLERARAYRSLTISMTVELLEKCIINIGRLHNGLRVAEIVSKDALGEASASVIPFPPDEVLSQKISVRMGDTDCMHKVATFFGPTESCQELSSDRFRGSNVVAKTWVIKWEYRNDCKAAFHTLAPLVGMNVVWTHLAGIHNFHAARQQALAERGPQVLHPSAIGLLDTAKLVKNPTALELNDANFPSLSPQKSYATPPKSLPGTPITLHETESEPTGVMTATPAAAAISPTAVPLFSPTTNPRVQLPRVNKVEKAEVQPATLMTQSSPASVINPGTAVVSALSHPEQDHSEKVDGNVYEGALQLDTAVTAEKKSEPVVAGDHEQSWQAFAPATEPAINVTQRLARPTGVVDPCSIFVGNLRQDMDWSERRLNLIFGRYGNIESIKYCVANYNGRPGFAFIRYSDPPSVELAIRAEDGQYMHGHLLHVSPRRMNFDHKNGPPRRSTVRKEYRNVPTADSVPGDQLKFDHLHSTAETTVPELVPASSSVESVTLPPVTPTVLQPPATIKDRNASQAQRKTSRPGSRKGQYSTPSMRGLASMESTVSNLSLSAETSSDVTDVAPSETPALIFNSLSNPPPAEEGTHLEGAAASEAPLRQPQEQVPSWPGVPYGAPPMPYPGYVYQGYWLPHPGAITPFTPRRSNQPPAYSADTPPRQPVAPHGQQPHSYMPWIQVGFISPINEIQSSGAQQPVHHMFPATPPGGHEQYLRPRQGRSNVPGSTTHPVDLPASFVQSQAGLIPVWGEHVINQYFAENPQVFDPRRGVFGGQVAQGPLGIAMPQTPQSATPNRGMFDPNGMAQPKRFAQHERTDTNQSFTSTSSFNSGTHAPSDGSPPRMPGGPPPAYGMHPVYAYGYSYPPPPVPYVSQRPSMPGDAQAYLQFHEGGR